MRASCAVPKLGRCAEERVLYSKTYSMTMSNQYVFGANALISALLLPTSIPRQAFGKAFDMSVMLLSDALIVELSIVWQTMLPKGPHNVAHRTLPQRRASRYPHAAQL